MGRDDAGAGGLDGEKQGAHRRRSGELSALVLDVLRQAEAALPPGDVRDRLNAAGAGGLAYTTVVTILSRLHAQGLVERYRTGRAYAYVAVADTTQLAARKMRKVLDSETDRDAASAPLLPSWRRSRWPAARRSPSRSRRPRARPRPTCARRRWRPERRRKP